MIRKTVSVRQDQEEWLDDHPEINFSGLVREALDEQMGDSDNEEQEDRTIGSSDSSNDIRSI